MNSIEQARLDALYAAMQRQGKAAKTVEAYARAIPGVAPTSSTAALTT
jgi:hypothetical protein